jgi:hypothetical protein
VDFFEAATSANFDKAANLFDLGTQEGVKFGVQNLNYVQGEYQPSAVAAGTMMQVISVRPPPSPSPPTVGAALAAREEAMAAAGRANEEWLHATADAVGATAGLVGAHVQHAAIGGKQNEGEKAFFFGEDMSPPPTPPPPETPRPETEPTNRLFFLWGLRTSPSAKNRDAPLPLLAVAACAIGAAVGGVFAGGMLAVTRIRRRAAAAAQTTASAAMV